MKKLIVTADDFGLTERVNEAIVLAYRRGIVTSASFMVNGRAFESAVDFARHNPGLDIGIHLNLTDHPFKFVGSILSGKISRPDVEREIRAQIEKALGTGLQITHVDGHKHVHALPLVLRIIREVAHDYGIQGIRASVTRAPEIASLLRRNPKSRRAIIKQCVLAKIASAAWQFSWHANTQSGMISPDDFYGIEYTGFLDLEAIRSIVHDLAPGVHELMCHPGYVDDELSRTATRLRAQRERELALLTSREVRNLIEDAGIQLVSYRDLVDSRARNGDTPASQTPLLCKEGNTP